MRKVFAILALLVSVLGSAPALAASTPTLELAAWVRSNTNLAVSQVAIAGPENVYSLEPLGPRLPTGEVLALVRTEAVSDGWRDVHQFQSWDAHMLFDCQGARVRVLRSASYADRGRVGPARADERGDAWYSPQADAPAAKLLAAACDPTFNWPLRDSPASAPSKATPLGGPSMLQTASARSSSVAGPMSPVLLQTAVEIARTPAVRLADVQPSEPVLQATAETTVRVEAPRPAGLAAPAQPDFAPSAGRLQKAALADPAPLGLIASAEPAGGLMRATFTAAPSVSELQFAPPPALSGQPRPNVLASAAAATRRLADAGRDWFRRRVKVALHGGRQMAGRAAPAAVADVRT